MLRENFEFSKKYFPILDQISGLKKRMHLQQVNFIEPWWKIIWDNRNLLAISLLIESVAQVFIAAVPAVVGWAINSSNWIILLYLILFWVLVATSLIISNYLNVIAAGQIIYSVHYQAVKFFLTVDPIFHSTRSSGQIIAKVNRGSEAYESFLDTIWFDLLKIVIRSSTVVVAMFSFSPVLGWVSLGMILFIGIISLVTKIILVQITAPAWLKADDKAKAVNLETLREVYLIRSAFASFEQDQRLIQKNQNLMSTVGNSWFAHTFIDLSIRILYILSVGIVIWLTHHLIQVGEITSVLGLSLILTYISGSSDILQVGRFTERLMDRWSRINDLFQFIRGFGKQTFPVINQ
ncbi:MAG: hypothetical protein OHK0017_07420 [Patescibacteria group bacterium]